jgi:hypothetical protein
MWNESNLPVDYLWYLKFKGGNIPPWSFISGEASHRMSSAIAQGRPSHPNTYAFALRADAEEVAVFERDVSGRPVVRIIQLDTPVGTELVASYETFCDWLVSAAKDARPFLTAGRQRPVPH